MGDCGVSSHSRFLLLAEPFGAARTPSCCSGLLACDCGVGSQLSERFFSPVNQEPLPFLDCIVYCFGLVFLFLKAQCFCVLLSSHEFESEQIPELSVRDVHSVSSLCKMYFRELPTPLLTEQLYGKFSVSTRQWLSCPSSLGLLAWPVTYTHACAPRGLFF